MIQFYAPDIEESPILPEGESAHCIRVLRMKEGEEIIVTDGKGSRFICEIIKAHHSHTELEIKKKLTLDKGWDYSLTLAVAPTKNTERMEWMVEKAVEIGVDKIVFLKCKRSERKGIRADRISKVMISAMKQSLAVNLPVLEEIVEYEKFVRNNSENIQKFFGYCSSSFPKKEFVKECRPGGKVVIMIGPEGDFTQDEVDLAIQNGYVPVTFGEKRLRTETAGVFAICAVNVINQMA